MNIRAIACAAVLLISTSINAMPLIEGNTITLPNDGDRWKVYDLGAGMNVCRTWVGQFVCVVQAGNYQIRNLETDFRQIVTITNVEPPPPPMDGITTFVAGTPGTPLGTCPAMLVEIFNRWTNDPDILDYDLDDGSGGDADLPELCQRGFQSPLGPFLNISLVSNFETDYLSEYFINNESISWRALMTAGDTAACAVAFGCNNLVLTNP